MKKIVFVMRSLNTGGVERALINQLFALSGKEYDISLISFSKAGTYLKKVPGYVHVYNCGFIFDCISKSYQESKKNILFFAIRNISAMIAKLFGSKFLFSILFQLLHIDAIDTEFDYAISYQNDLSNHSLYYGCNLFTLTKIKSKCKAVWLHTDFEFMKDNYSIDEQLYLKFDYIIHVSNYMKAKFDRLNLFPHKRSKVIYSYIPINMIRLESDMVYKRKENIEFTIISVCRMDRLKSVFQLCEIAKKLDDIGVSFRWIFCGNGPELSKCKDYVNGHNLNKKVILLGDVNNPYSLMKNADLFVSGSLIETFGLSIVEALVLNLPVIALRYEAISEVLKDGVNGIVANSYDDIFSKIYQCVKCSEFYSKIKLSSKPLIDYNLYNSYQFRDIFPE